MVRFADAQPPDVRLLHPEERLPRPRHGLSAKPPARRSNPAKARASSTPSTAISCSRCSTQGFSTQPEQRELDADLKNLLGDVPYLNGGLFDVHELEQHNPKIDIPDEAFERIFGFFDQYEWTLDTRPLRNDKEINPDVLGYIFEKYINQKQMGAYYTKEDITDYISRNTIIPYLFDEAPKKCAVAFQPGSALVAAAPGHPRSLHLSGRAKRRH